MNGRTTWRALFLPLLSILPLLPGAACSSSTESQGNGADAGATQDATSASDTGSNDAADAQATADASANDGANDAPVDAASGDAPHTCAAPGATPVNVSGHVTASTTLTCNRVYQIFGLAIVDAGSTLTIERGTTLLMGTDASLIVAPGGKLVAEGTRDEPIVFTSAQPENVRGPGDWGCVALVGRAPGNWGKDINGVVMTSHTPDASDWPNPGFPYIAGGNDYADSSGSLKYVRMEYGGLVRTSGGSNDHEMLGLYGVGAGTSIDHIDLRQGNWGCLFAEGGAFDGHHLICQYGGNSAFGFTRGNKSRLQFLIDQEDPKKAAEGIGIKGPFDGNQLTPLTDPTIYNVTLCGTNGSLATAKDPYGIFLNRQPAGHVFNAIASGFRAGVAMLNGAHTSQGGIEIAGTEIRSSIFFGNFDPNTPNTNIAYPSPPNDTDLVTWFQNPAWKNSTSDPSLSSCFDPSALRLAPAASLTTNASTPPNDGFFDPAATFIGALKDGSDGWAKGAWVVWSGK
jgi:hypothetical protein